MLTTTGDPCRGRRQRIACDRANQPDADKLVKTDKKSIKIPPIRRTDFGRSGAACRRKSGARTTGARKLGSRKSEIEQSENVCLESDGSVAMNAGARGGETGAGCTVSRCPVQERLMSAASLVRVFRASGRARSCATQTRSLSNPYHSLAAWRVGARELANRANVRRATRRMRLTGCGPPRRSPASRAAMTCTHLVLE
jgi:hypothetical protein